jgi:SSS family solute:Na+ symporter
MVTRYDYLNIAFYFAFIAGVGIYFARRSKNTSDYFRAGGLLPWWVTGTSAWMASFSAWTFTGAAGKMYESGPYAFGLYYSAIIPMLVLLFFTCYRFRRMRVVTPLEAVRLRYGPGSQQFFTWIRLPFMLLFGGVGLNAIGVFMAAVFNVELWVVIIALGLIVTFLALLGGSFGVAASDFVQMFLVVTVTVTVAVLALKLPEIGGVSGMIAKAPAQHYDWSQLARPGFITLWVVALTITKLFEQNSMDASAKYLMARSDKHARLMVLIPIVGSLLGPLIWIVPPTVAAILHGPGEMAAKFPTLRFPNEAAFLVTASEVLPQGMLGLLVCGIFAATLTTMDAGLNQGAGIFVRNFYLPVIHPDCHEKKLLIISKVATGIFGLTMIGIGLLFGRFRQLGLFDLLNQVAVSLAVPLVIPLFFGLFYKRTPAWSTWTTALLGLTGSSLVKFVLKPGHVAWIPGFNRPFTTEETTQFYLFATVAVVGTVCISWYFFTSLFYERSPTSYKAAVEEFFTRLRTPVEAHGDEEAREDQAVGSSIGKLSVVYGGFVALLALVPNPLQGRLCFLACGGVMIGTGLFLMWHHRTGKPPVLSGKTETAVETVR